MALKVGELFASFDLDASGMTGTIRTIETQLEGIGADMIRAGSTLSSMVTDPLKGIGKSILSAGMDFTSQMSRVEAISGASAAEMEKLNAEALKMGSTTQFTATEAGQALEYMAMAGWKTSAMINGLEPIMNLAATSGENLADVSDIVTDAMTAFGLEAKKENIARFSDVLAQAASNSNTNVGLMGETFKYVAPVAGALGYNIEDAAIAIGLMANAGIKGSQSGTALRALLTRLSKPTKEVKTAMKELGLSMTTSTGEMKPLRQLMTEMRGKFSGLTEQEKALYAATLAGQEGMSGLLAIVSASDKDFNKLAASIDNCEGATGRMAATVLANAKGDWTLFQSAVEGAYVALFTLNEQAIRKTIQSMTGLVDKFNALDGPMKQVILKMGILAAAIGPVLMYGGKALMLAGKIAPTIAALVSPLGIVAGTFLLFGTAAMDAGNDMGKAFEKYTQIGARKLKVFDKTVQSTIKNISGRIPKLAASLKTGLAEIVPQAAEAGMNLFSSLADVVSDNAADVAQVGAQAVTSLLNGFAKGAPKLIPSVVSATVSVLAAAIRNAPNLLEAGIDLAKGIFRGFKAVKWGELGVTVLTALEETFRGLGKTVQKAFVDAKNYIKTLKWADVVAAIKGAFHFGSDWLKGLILGDSLTDQSTWGDAGAKIWGWIKGGFVSVTGWLKGLILGDTLTEESTWKDVGSTVWGWIKSGFGAAGDWLKKLFLGDEGENGGAWSDAGEKIVGQIAASFKALTPEKLAAKIGDLSALASTILTSIISNKATFAAKAAEFVAELVGGLKDFSAWDTFTAAFSALASGLLGGVVTGIQKTITAAADIAGAIGGLLENINKEGWATYIGASAGTLIDALIEKLNSVVKTPDLTRLCENIATGITNSLGILTDAVLGFADWFIDGGGIIRLIDCGVAIVKGIAKGIAVSVPKIAAGVIKSFGDVIFGLLGVDVSDEAVYYKNVEFKLTSNGEDVLNEFGESVKAYGSELYQILNSQMVDGDFTVIDQWKAFTALQAIGAKQSIEDYQNDFSEAGVAAAQYILSGTQNGLDSPENVALMLALFSNNMADGMKNASGDLYDLIDNEFGTGLWNRLIEAVQNHATIDEIRSMFGEAGKSMSDELIQTIISGIENGRIDLVEVMQELGIEIPEWLNQALKESWTGFDTSQIEESLTSAVDASMSEAGKNGADCVANAYATQMSTKTEEMKSATTSTVNESTMPENFTTAADNAQTTGENIGAGVSDGVSGKETDIATAVQGLVASMNTTFEPTVQSFGNTARMAMTNVSIGIQAMQGNAALSVRNAGNAVVNAMRDSLNGSTGYSLGNDLMRGIIGGINSMAGMLSSAARTVVRNAVAAMRKAADAHSPSRETLALGRDMDAGGAIGLSGGMMAAAATQAVKDTIRAMTAQTRLSDPSVGTVMTARANARQTAAETANSLSDGENREAYASAVGRMIADRLIESGALGGDVVMDGEKVGRKTAPTVSKSIADKAKKTVSGRSAQGVLI